MVIKVFKPSHPSHIWHLEIASTEYEKAPETFFSVSQDRHARSEGMRPHRARQNRCQDLNIGDDMKMKVVLIKKKEMVDWPKSMADQVSITHVAPFIEHKHPFAQDHLEFGNKFLSLWILIF